MILVYKNYFSTRTYEYDPKGQVKHDAEREWSGERVDRLGFN